MSTKNIALDSRVYARLSGMRNESESFSKAVSRLLDEVSEAHTGRDVLARLAGVPDISQDEADSMLRIVEENRLIEDWESHDLR
jgi:predicted CopG family antitoxin